MTLLLLPVVLGLLIGQISRLPIRVMVAAVALTLLAVETSQAASPAPGPLATTRSFALLTDVPDQVFGTRAEGLSQKMTPLFATDWRSDDDLAAMITRTLEDDGRRVERILPGEVAADQAQKPSRERADPGKLSSAISDSHPGLDVDVHLIVLAIPLDRYGHPSDPGGYFLTWGFLGLLSQASEKFRPAYVVRVNDFITAGDWGKVECTVGYTLVAVDAKSHKVIAKAENQLTHSRLPDRFWIGDYVSLSEEDKGALRQSCVDGLLGSVRAKLQSLGVAAQPPAE